MILPLADDPTTTGTVAYDQQHVLDAEASGGHPTDPSPDRESFRPSSPRSVPSALSALLGSTEHGLSASAAVVVVAAV